MSRAYSIFRQVPGSHESIDYRPAAAKHQSPKSSCWCAANAQNILGLLEILGFIVSWNWTFIHLIDFTTAIVFKPIVNT